LWRRQAATGATGAGRAVLLVLTPLSRWAGCLFTRANILYPRYQKEIALQRGGGIALEQVLIK